MKKILLPLILIAAASTQALTETDKQLFAAVESGSIADAQAALSAGADINALRGCSDSPLYLAVVYNEIELAQFLIEQGAEYASSDTFPANKPFIVAALIENPAILLLMFEKSTIGQHTLDEALQDVLTFYLDSGCYSYDLEERAALLLEHGASPFSEFTSYDFEGTGYEFAVKHRLNNLLPLFNKYRNL